MSASEIYSPAEEEAAFGAVYSEHHQKLLRYCQYRLRDRHEAEDVMQEAFVRAWRSMPAQAYGSNFYPWLRVVAGNLCTDVLRKRSRSEPMADIELGSFDGGMDRITNEEDRDLVRQALLRLNDRHRDALLMREGEGLTYDQIAQRTGATSATVESLLWRARQALKREFTVISGRTGALAPVPVFGAMAARAAAARRRLAASAARRFPALGRLLTDNPSSHLVMAALTTLTLVGGIAAATLGANGAHASTPAANIVSSSALASSNSSQNVAAAATSAASKVTTAASQAASTSAAAASASASATVAAGRTGRTTPRTPSLGTVRVIDPVASGSGAAHTARTAPVKIDFLNAVVVGASPAEATKYVGQTQTAVSNSAAPVLAGAVNSISTNNKENVK